MIRTSPHLALVRNSLSSGVTTSARNMARQWSLPPAKRCSRGTDRAEGIGRTGAPRQPGQNIQAGQETLNTSKQTCEKYNLDFKWLKLFWLLKEKAAECPDFLSIWQCDRGHRSKQLGQYHVHAVREPDHLSPKFSLCRLTVHAWALHREIPHQSPGPTVEQETVTCKPKNRLMSS